MKTVSAPWFIFVKAHHTIPVHSCTYLKVTGVTELQVRIQDLCKGGTQPRFCQHRAAESRERQKFGPQNGPPPRSAPELK